MKLDFYVDYCYEGGEELSRSLTGRYGFSMDFTDEEYEAIFRIYEDGEEFAKWGDWWKPGDALYEKINGVATDCLNRMLADDNGPDFPKTDSIDTLWTLAPDSERAFDERLEKESE